MESENFSNPCFSTDIVTVFRNCTGLILVGFKAPRWLALPVYGYITPVITLITAATNTCVVLILCQRQFLRASTNVILSAMAVAELLTALSSLPWSLYYYTFRGHTTEENIGLPKFWCESFPYMSEILPTICHTAAIWLTVFLAVTRHRQVVTRGLRVANTKNGTGRTLTFIVIICVAAVVCEIPKILSSKQFSRQLIGEIFVEPDDLIELTYRACIYQNLPWVRKVGTNVFFSTYYWLLALFVHVVPCVFLIVYTMHLLIYLNKADRRRKTTLRGYSTASQRPPSLSRSPFSRGNLLTRRGPRSFHASTRMLTVIIGIFLVIELPAATIYILHVFTVTSEVDQRVYETMNIVFVIRNLLILVSYPVNFAVYCGMSKQFRSAFRRVILRKRNIGDENGNDLAGNTTVIRATPRCRVADNRRKSSTHSDAQAHIEYLKTVYDPLSISLMIQTGQKLPYGLTESETL